MLSEFLIAHREHIVACALARGTARTGRLGVGVTSGLSLVVDQLVDRLRAAERDAPAAAAARAVGAELTWGAARHAREVHRAGLPVAEVVHHYGDLCQVVTELATRMGTPIATGEFDRFTACLDEAIAAGVTEHSRQREMLLAELRAQRLDAVAHELRNRLAVAILAFDTLKTGAVGVGGSTVAVLERSLAAMRVIVDVSLAEVRSAARSWRARAEKA